MTFIVNQFKYKCNMNQIESTDEIAILKMILTNVKAVKGLTGTVKVKITNT